MRVRNKATSQQQQRRPYHCEKVYQSTDDNGSGACILRIQDSPTDLNSTEITSTNSTEPERGRSRGILMDNSCEEVSIGTATSERVTEGYVARTECDRSVLGRRKRPSYLPCLQEDPLGEEAKEDTPPPTQQILSQSHSLNMYSNYHPKSSPRFASETYQQMPNLHSPQRHPDIILKKTISRNHRVTGDEDNNRPERPQSLVSNNRPQYGHIDNLPLLPHPDIQRFSLVTYLDWLRTPYCKSSLLPFSNSLRRSRSEPELPQAKAKRTLTSHNTNSRNARQEVSSSKVKWSGKEAKGDIAGRGSREGTGKGREERSAWKDNRAGTEKWREGTTADDDKKKGENKGKEGVCAGRDNSEEKGTTKYGDGEVVRRRNKDKMQEGTPSWRKERWGVHNQQEKKGSTSVTTLHQISRNQQHKFTFNRYLHASSNHDSLSNSSSSTFSNHSILRHTDEAKTQQKSFHLTDSPHTVQVHHQVATPKCSTGDEKKERAKVMGRVLEVNESKTAATTSANKKTSTSSSSLISSPFATYKAAATKNITTTTTTTTTANTAKPTVTAATTTITTTSTITATTSTTTTTPTHTTTSNITATATVTRAAVAVTSDRCNKTKGEPRRPQLLPILHPSTSSSSSSSSRQPSSQGKGKNTVYSLRANRSVYITI